MKKNSKIYIAGHNGMVGSAILRYLKFKGFNNLIYANSSELEVQFISNVGSTSFEVEGDAPFILTEGKI